MADVKIVDLPEASTLYDTDDIAVEQADGTKKASIDKLTDALPFIFHGDEVGSLPVPINADQLEGHPASYFQPLLTAGEGISIASNVISSSVVTTTPTTTNGNIQSSNIIARKIGDVLFLSGYIVVASNQTFTGDSTVCFTVSERPSGNRFFTFQNYTSNGPIVYVVKLNASGQVVFNNTITVATTYLFFNAALPL